MARLSTLPLIVVLYACAAPAKNDPQTVHVAKTPSSTALPEAPPPSIPRTRVVVTRDQPGALWSVSTDGKTKRLDWPEGAVYTTGRAGAGSDAPIASLDGKRVAYVRDGARKGPIVIRDLERATSTTVRIPVPRSEVLLADWSPDGRRILYSFAFLDGPNGAIANPDGSELRFAFYDVVSQRMQPILVPDRCEYQAWLPDGAVLVTCENGSVLGLARGSDFERIASKHQRFTQAHVGENGSIAVIADDGVLLLAAGSYAERVGPSGAYADYQFPKPSPSGRRVGYAHHVRSSNSGRVRVDLEVDGKKVAEEAYDFEWLDEGTLVVLKTNAAPSVVRLM